MLRAVSVCFVNDSAEIGGAERSLLTLIDELPRQGLASLSVVLFHDGPLAEELATRGVHHLVCPLPTEVGHLTRLYRRYRTRDYAAALVAGARVTARVRHVLARERPTLVHTNSLKAHVLAGASARAKGIPVVWHVRDILPPGPRRRALSGIGSVVPDAIIVNSRSTGSQFAGRRSARKVTAIDNAVDLDRFRPMSGADTRARWGVEPGQPVIGMVAHLTPWKGHEFFVRSAARIRREIPGARFVVVGGEIYATDGHAGYRDHLAAVAAEIGVGEVVRFEPATDDVPGVLNALDVVVHPPVLPEPFGRVIIEAMACGRPVVATNTGGIPEVLEDGVTGVLVRPNDPEGLATAVVSLLGDRDRCRGLGERALALARDRFAPAKSAAAVVDVYRRVLDRRSRWPRT